MLIQLMLVLEMTGFGEMVTARFIGYIVTVMDKDCPVHKVIMIRLMLAMATIMLMGVLAMTLSMQAKGLMRFMVDSVVIP